MSDIWGALAQSAPAITTLTDIYTCPAGRNATVEVILCNRGADGATRLAHAINGAADTAAQYLLYDFPISAGAAKVTTRFTVTAGDILRGYASTGDFTFNVNGIEEVI